MAYSKVFREEVLLATEKRSQNSIAQEVGVSQATIAKMITGWIPSDDLLRRFAVALGKEPAHWVRLGKVYREEAHLREELKLSDLAIKTILDIYKSELEQHKIG